MGHLILTTIIAALVWTVTREISRRYWKQLFCAALVVAMWVLGIAGTLILCVVIGTWLR